MWFPLLLKAQMKSNAHEAPILFLAAPKHESDWATREARNKRYPKLNPSGCYATQTTLHGIVCATRYHIKTARLSVERFIERATRLDEQGV